MSDTPILATQPVAPPVPLMPPEQAQARLAEIQGSPALARALMDPNDAGHLALKKEYDALFPAAYPEPGEQIVQAMPTPQAMDASAIAAVINNNERQMPATFADGWPVTSEDKRAAREIMDALPGMIEGITGITRADVSGLTSHLWQGWRAPEGLTAEQAMARLAQDTGGEAEAAQEVEAARRFVAHLTAQGLDAAAMLDRTGNGNNVHVIRAMAVFGRALGQEGSR